MIDKTREDEVDAHLESMEDDDFIMAALNRRDALLSLAQGYYAQGARMGSKSYVDVSAELFLTSRVLNKLIQEKLFRPVAGSKTTQ